MPDYGVFTKINSFILTISCRNTTILVYSFVEIEVLRILVPIFIVALSACATKPPSVVESEARAEAASASARLLEEIASVEGCHAVKSARAHDGTELIFAWFENRDAVLRWFEHPYHRKLLRDAGRPEDNVAAQHFGDDVGPILVLASVAYPAERGAINASMFDDPVSGRPNRFSIEYYVPLAGGAYMVEPFAPPGVKERIVGLRDVFDD